MFLIGLIHSLQTGSLVLQNSRRLYAYKQGLKSCRTRIQDATFVKIYLQHPECSLARGSGTVRRHLGSGMQALDNRDGALFKSKSNSRIARHAVRQETWLKTLQVALRLYGREDAADDDVSSMPRCYYDAFLFCLSSNS
jgi:hypothetical protein